MVSLFLLSQVFLIVSYGPLVKTLAAIILNSNSDVIQSGSSKILEEYIDIAVSKSVAFTPPKETLEKSLENINDADQDDTVKKFECNSGNETKKDCDTDEKLDLSKPSTSYDSIVREDTFSSLNELEAIITQETIEEIKHLNVTDEEKEQRLALESPLIPQQISNNIQESTTTKPFLETVLNSLCCTENDYAALFALCLLYALANNQVRT